MSINIPDPLSALPASMYAGVALLPAAQPIVLLTRHSIRLPADGQGFASYALPLTDLGRELAAAWGEYLHTTTRRRFYACLTSPIERCVDTALRMLEGAKAVQSPVQSALDLEVVKTPLLVEPGSFVIDASRLGAVFRQYGALKFINSFLTQQFEGMKQPSRGVLDILSLLHSHLPSDENSLLLAVSHDTILAAFLAVMHDSTEISCDDWPEMMEGVFLWFEGETFDSSRVHWVWRGVAESRLISSLVVSDPIAL
jgi:broad specificity phosphatase PhoE